MLIPLLLSAFGRVTMPATCGVDCSFIPEYDAAGVKYYENSIRVDPLTALAHAGCNLLRLRVWNDPTNDWCDEAHTLVMAKRGRALHRFTGHVAATRLPKSAAPVWNVQV